jgi:hypothetical protein
MIDFVTAVPLIIAIVEAAKMAGLPKRLTPLFSIALGVVGFYFVGDGDTAQRIVNGLIVSLTASGLYSTTKTTVKK